MYDFKVIKQRNLSDRNGTHCSLILNRFLLQLHTYMNYAIIPKYVMFVDWPVNTLFVYMPSEQT